MSILKSGNQRLLNFLNLAVLCHLLDYTSTVWAILGEHGIEGNPMVNWLIGIVGLQVGLLIPKVLAINIIMLIAEWFRSGTMSELVTNGFRYGFMFHNSLYVLVVLSNFIICLL